MAADNHCSGTRRRDDSSPKGIFERFQTFLQRCVSIDLEVNPAAATVFAFAAVRNNNDPAIIGRKGYTAAALDRLERELAEAPHLLGHNIIRHDLPHLVALRPRLAALVGSPIDTLWLNPLAFPRNPYHHLIKHHHDGCLQAGHINDPELDARLVLKVLHDQLGALQQQHVDRPDAIAAYHYLTTRMGNAAGFDAVFQLDGGAVRTNLSFEVRKTARGTKLTDILDVIEARLPQDGASGAIVYCATRSTTERVAAFIKQQGLSAEHFHAGLPPDEMRSIQERFRVGELRIIAATNAFGMGIDKPDIRLVVHGDVHGSLENYLQEAGRAGRDREHADCVLLYAPEDVRRQFSLSARSRLARHEIGAILKALRRVDERSRKTGTVVATSGEIVQAELEREFERESATDDTRVKTARLVARGGDAPVY